MRYLITATFILIAMILVRPASAAEVELEDGTVVEITIKGAQRVGAECSAANPTACDMGSTKYCTYSQDARTDAFTFETSTFLRACDTNADGRYDYCLDYMPHANGGYTFEDQSYYRYCGNGDTSWNPIQDRVVPE